MRPPTDTAPNGVARSYRPEIFARVLHLTAVDLDEVSRVGTWITTRIKEAAPRIVASAG